MAPEPPIVQPKAPPPPVVQPEAPTPAPPAGVSKGESEDVKREVRPDSTVQESPLSKSTPAGGRSVGETGQSGGQGDGGLSGSSSSSGTEDSSPPGKTGKRRWRLPWSLTPSSSDSVPAASAPAGVQLAASAPAGGRLGRTLHDGSDERSVILDESYAAAVKSLRKDYVPPPSTHSTAGRVKAELEDQGTKEKVFVGLMLACSREPTEPSKEEEFYLYKGTKQFLLDFPRIVDGTLLSKIMESKVNFFKFMFKQLSGDNILKEQERNLYPNLAKVQGWSTKDFNSPEDPLVLFYALCEVADQKGFGNFWRKLVPFIAQSGIQNDISIWFTGKHPNTPLNFSTKWVFDIDAQTVKCVMTVGFRDKVNPEIIVSSQIFEVQLQFSSLEQGGDQYGVTALLNDQRCHAFEKWLADKYPAPEAAPTPAAAHTAATPAAGAAGVGKTT